MFQNKLVAIVNKQIEGGKAMNALAHILFVAESENLKLQQAG